MLSPARFRFLATTTLLAAAALATACGGDSSTDFVTAASSTTGTSGVGGAGGAAASTAGSGGMAVTNATATGATTASTSASTGSGMGGCGNPTPGATSACMSYKPTTIAAMRQAKTSGCFELQHVGLVARTDSPTEPRLYVQDKGGTDYSAIVAKCTTTASHACAAPVLAKIPGLYDTMTDGAELTIRGYYTYGGVSQFENVLIEDVIDECKTVPRPTPVSIAPTDIQRDKRVPAKWFQRAHVVLPQNDPLVMYDFSPKDLMSSVSGCPDYFGFAMIPKSANLAATQGCNGTKNPAGRPADPREVLVGRQFFKQMLFSTDCACIPGSGAIQLKPSGQVSGLVTGYLIIETDVNSTQSYQVFQAAADQAFPIK